MATQRAALIWASFSLAALLYGTTSAQQGPSIPMEYCASVNTADAGPFFYTWQSDGRCFDNCTDLKYALAIVQEKNCWCSNLIPNSADRKSLEDCEYPCPGYPTDFCGGDGAFGYMEVSGFTPTGTAPAGSKTSSSASTSSSSSSTVDSTTTTSSSSSSSSSSSASSSSATSSSSSGETETSDSAPKPTIETVTVGGTVRTVTATPQATNTDAAAVVPTESKGLQGGAIAGIVIGVVGGLAVIAAFIWLWLAKRRRQQQDDEGSSSVAGLGVPIRGGSGSGSPGGMMATPKMGDVAESRYPLGQQFDAAKRRSHLMPVDPRLDPFAKGIYADQNRSRESFNSLQDNQDYSRRVHQPPRVLRATNPDPDVDD